MIIVTLPCATSRFMHSPIQVHVHTLLVYVHVRAVLATCAAQYVVTSTISQWITFCGENVCDRRSNHEIHGNIVPQNLELYSGIKYHLRQEQRN